LDVGKRITAIFWRSLAGDEPVREFLRRLPPEDRKVVGRDIGRCEFGWPLGMPVARSLGGGLWEVRSSLASRREVRVFFYVDGVEMVLLHAIVKKSAWAPVRELALARRRMTAHQRGVI
jgi:phage-related protein